MSMLPSVDEEPSIRVETCPTVWKLFLLSTSAYRIQQHQVIRTSLDSHGTSTMSLTTITARLREYATNRE